MDKSCSSGRKKARTDKRPNGECLLMAYLSSDESVSGDLGEASSGEEYVYKHTTPFQTFTELLSSEVSNYLDGGISSCRCALCPFREFSRPCRVRQHVETYHCIRNNWCASGRKQMKVCIALYDNDMETNDSGFIALPNI